MTSKIGVINMRKKQPISLKKNLLERMSFLRLLNSTHDFFVDHKTEGDSQDSQRQVGNDTNHSEDRQGNQDHH